MKVQYINKVILPHDGKNLVIKDESFNVTVMTSEIKVKDIAIKPSNQKKKKNSKAKK